MHVKSYDNIALGTGGIQAVNECPVLASYGDDIGSPSSSEDSIV